MFETVMVAVLPSVLFHAWNVVLPTSGGVNETNMLFANPGLFGSVVAAVGAIPRGPLKRLFDPCR